LTPLAKSYFSTFNKVGTFALNRARLASLEALDFEQAGAFALDRARLASPEALALTSTSYEVI